MKPGGGLLPKCTLDARTAAVISINDPWSELVAGYFKQEFERAGGRILRSFAVNPQDSDFRSAFTAIRQIRPDVIYSPITDEHIGQSPDAFEGIYQSQLRDPSGAGMDKLRDCIAATRNFSGVSQTISFNAGGSSPQIASIFRISAGRFVLEKP